MPRNTPNRVDRCSIERRPPGQASAGDGVLGGEDAAADLRGAGTEVREEGAVSGLRHGPAHPEQHPARDFLGGGGASGG